MQGQDKGNTTSQFNSDIVLQGSCRRGRRFCGVLRRAEGEIDCLQILLT